MLHSCIERVVLNQIATFQTCLVLLGVGVDYIVRGCDPTSPRAAGSALGGGTRRPRRHRRCHPGDGGRPGLS